MKDRFEYPVLTKILGSLNYPVLKRLKDEVKVNAASIFSELGGGKNGHLGLVSSKQEYAQVSGIPYVRHTQPKRPTITVRMTEHTIANQIRGIREQKRELQRNDYIRKDISTVNCSSCLMFKHV